MRWRELPRLRWIWRRSRGLGVCPVLGDYLDEDGVARHATDRVARDLMALMAQTPDRHVNSQ